MPDFLKLHDDFSAMASSIAQMNPLGAVEKPVNPYSPCWCGSGKKWKFCHKDRDKQPEISFGELQARRASNFHTGPCQHPSASARSCSSPQSIQSHTVQRRGGLASVAENGHVYSIKSGFFEIEKNCGQVNMKKMGVAKASTFPGFCSHHDTELFRPVELADSTLDQWNGFLLSFRAITYELATKIAALDAHITSRELIDHGKPFEMQVTTQSFMHFQQIGLQKGRDDVTRWKAEYDQAFLNRDLSNFRIFGITFDGTLPFAAAGAFMPEYDFAGRHLQRLDTNEVVSHLALNVTQLGGKTCAVFGWTGGLDCAASKLVESFKVLPDADKATAVLLLALEYIENFYCTPSWWESLSSELSASLHEKIAGGMLHRSPNALVEPAMRALVCSVESVLER